MYMRRMAGQATTQVAPGGSRYAAQCSSGSGASGSPARSGWPSQASTDWSATTASARLVAQPPPCRAARPPAVDFQRREARHDHFGGLGQQDGRHGRCGKIAAQGTLPLGLAQLGLAVLLGGGRRQAGEPTLIGGGPRRPAATALKS